mmetsp:Transcript_4134/g.9380  ORF Transcript_4134/g.9380 Transcript_4134/m.9380 type:complete len:215 (+) Transcript_4134:79-723(+)
MGLLHIPRVALSCARGYYLRRTSEEASINLLGIGPSNAHVYNGRCGLVDIDGFGHMNNASYLVHAELARWEMSAANGSLGANISEQCAFLVAGAAVRYRREIGPLFRKFQIKTFVGGLDNRNLWVYHTFHYPECDGDKQSKVLAQILVQAVVAQNRKVLEPEAYLKEICGIDADEIDKLKNSHENDLMMQKRSRFEELEEALRASAAADDKRVT